MLLANEIARFLNQVSQGKNRLINLILRADIDLRNIRDCFLVGVVKRALSQSDLRILK